MRVALAAILLVLATQATAGTISYQRRYPTDPRPQPAATASDLGRAQKLATVMKRRLERPGEAGGARRTWRYGSER
jgi:hypothetical protein